MIKFKQYSDIVNKISKKFNIPKHVALKVAQKAQEKGINLLKWQQYLSMLGTFANTIPAENDPRIEEYISEEITKNDLDQIEKYADKLFAVVGIDIEFTRHFLDRVNDARNKKPINSAELIRLFRLTYKKYGKKIAKMNPDAEAVISDMETDVNMPFVLNLDKDGMLDLVAKTVMRKKDFKTRNQKLRV